MASTELEVVPREMQVNGRRVVVESYTTLVPARSLEALANTIRHEHGLVRKAAQNMLEHAVLCGNALIEAKQRVPRGQWVRWLETNDIGRGVAPFYMRVAVHADLLREAEISSWAAANEFLRDRGLTEGQIPEETAKLIRELADRGMSQKAIAEHVGRAPSTVYTYLKDPLRGGRKCKGSRTAPRRRGRKRGTAQGTLGVAITDDLVEGAALKLRELFGSGGDVTDDDRDAAVRILRAAFTYDGPIPGEEQD